MNFTPLLATIKKDLGQFDAENVVSMRFDMLPFEGTHAMYVTANLRNGKVYEGWADDPTAEVAKLAKARQAAEVLPASATATKAVPGSVHPTDSQPTVAPPVVTTETAYPAGQAPTKN